MRLCVVFFKELRKVELSKHVTGVDFGILMYDKKERKAMTDSILVFKS